MPCKLFFSQPKIFYGSLLGFRCAVGAAFESRYHPTFVTFPKSLVSFFVDRSRMFLEGELDDPTVATIQAIMVLSCHEVGNGNKSRGWLYSGTFWKISGA